MAKFNRTKKKAVLETENKRYLIPINGDTEALIHKFSELSTEYLNATTDKEAAAAQYNAAIVSGIDGLLGSNAVHDILGDDYDVYDLIDLFNAVIKAIKETSDGINEQYKRLTCQ